MNGRPNAAVRSGRCTATWIGVSILIGIVLPGCVPDTTDLISPLQGTWSDARGKGYILQIDASGNVTYDSWAYPGMLLACDGKYHQVSGTAYQLMIEPYAMTVADDGMTITVENHGWYLQSSERTTNCSTSGSGTLLTGSQMELTLIDTVAGDVDVYTVTFNKTSD
jgi:hypothetical protein